MLPYYGDVDQLKLAVRSVIAQTYPHWRLVVIDDGYPDPEPARWFAEMTDERIVYLRNDRNLGTNGNFRRAVELVTAEWFVMMGCDDVMGPEYLSTVARAVDRDAVDIVQPGVTVIDESGAVVLPLPDRVKRFLSLKVPEGGRVVGGEALAASLLRGDWAYFPSLAWRTSTVKRIGFREGLDVVMDLALILDIIASGGRMALLADKVFCYRRHSQSDSSIRALDGRRFEEERRFFAGEARRFTDLGWTRAARAARAHITSRLNAASLLPKAVTKGGSPSVLAKHIVS